MISRETQNARDPALQAQVERAMRAFDAQRAAVLEMREARRDKLIARGLDRAARGRYYDRMWGPQR